MARSFKSLAPKKITSWSFSRYSLWKQCPLKAKFAIIDKVKEPQNEAMRRGDWIHKQAEDYIRGKRRTLPDELKSFKDLLAQLRKAFKKKIQGAIVEDTWAFTQSWGLTTWNDWVGCWLRIKLDAAQWISEDELDIDDWKSGKFREESNAEYVEQLELYALGALVLFPHLQIVRPRLRYTDAGITFPRPGIDPPIEFTRADLPALKKKWEKRVKPMFADVKFAPRPGWYCRFCFFSQGHATGPKTCKF